MKNGPYILVLAPSNYPGKKYRGRYCYEHHLVYWRKYKKIPTSDEIIHHKNHVPTDNRIINLELLSKKQHNEHHSKDRSEKCKIKFNCGECGKEKIIKGNAYRSRLKIRKNGKLFCTRACGAKAQHKRKKLLASS